MKIYRINAFTDSQTGGNPAGVVLNADSLTDQEMLKIAEEVGYSETAFVKTSEVADFKVQFFTPSDEVDLCGHATIATFSLLFQEKIISKGNYTQETKAGVLAIEVTDEGIFMEQLIPTAYQIIEPKLIAKSLGIEVCDIIEPIQVFSTGLKDIIIHVKSLKVLEALQPDYELITQISQDNEVTGYHVFTLESLTAATAHCRNFAPLYAINEEAATGTASGALSGYLVHHHLIDLEDGIHHLRFEQGYEMNRPSEIIGNITIHNKKATKVIIGGKGTIQL